MPVVLGSVRKNRRSLNAARLVAARVTHAGHETELIDLKGLELPMYDEEPESETHSGVLVFKTSMARADGVIWHTPEYNHSFTSAIKNAIDYLDEEIRRKPSAVVGLGGLSGGVRAAEQLKSVLIELHSVPIRDGVHFTEARSLFDAEGQLLKTEFVPRIDLMVRELVWYARALKWGRDNVAVPARR
ncbi:MAG TPA: NAD(P)H-dependent oxidoreductase [Chloroflexota bacterium]|nr:NAD(P)H-dependent oxidoreductase [Chloroflexota bacterium]